MTETTLSYETGLFHTYDVDELPKTNNDRESEFQNYKRRLLRTLVSGWCQSAINSNSLCMGITNSTFVSLRNGSSYCVC